MARHRINAIACQINNGTGLTHARMVAIRLGKERHGEGVDIKARCGPSGSGCLSHV